MTDGVPACCDAVPVKANTSPATRASVALNPNAEARNLRMERIPPEGIPGCGAPGTVSRARDVGCQLGYTPDADRRPARAMRRRRVRGRRRLGRRGPPSTSSWATTLPWCWCTAATLSVGGASGNHEIFRVGTRSMPPRRRRSEGARPRAARRGRTPSARPRAAAAPRRGRSRRPGPPGSPPAPRPARARGSGAPAVPSIAPTPNGTHFDGSCRRCASVLPRVWISRRSPSARSTSARPRAGPGRPTGPARGARAGSTRSATVVLLVGLGLLVGRDVALVVAQHDLVVASTRSGSWA